MIKKQHYTAPGADIFELRVEGQLLTGSPWDTTNGTETMNPDNDVFTF